MRTILRKTYLLLSVSALLLLASCSNTRHLTEDQYLLKSYPTVQSQNKIEGDQLSEAIITKPNRVVGIPKVALSVHNIGVGMEKRQKRRHERKGKTEPYEASKFVTWLKYKAGEPPVLVDTNSLNRDLRNLRQVCMANGYFQPNLSFQIDTLRKWRGQKAKVTFIVDEGLPYKINKYEIVYQDSSRDPGLLNSQYMRQDEGMFQLEAGLQYNHNLFEYERKRGVRHSRIGGFYSFGPSMIRFLVDTNLAINRMVDTLRNRSSVNKWVNLEVQISETPPQYKIQEIEFRVLEPEPLKGSARSDTVMFHSANLTEEEMEELGLTYKKVDTTSDILFVVSRSLLPRLDFDFLADRVEFRKWDLYDVRKDERARRLLRQLGMFQYLLIKYIDLGNGRLKMQVDAKIVPQYQLRFGLESFTRTSFNDNSFLPSVGINTGIRNRNAFQRSELFELSLYSSVGLLTPQNEGDDAILQYKLGAEAKVQFNQFILSKPIQWFLPEKYTENMARYSPTSVVSASFDYTRRGQVNQIIPGFQLTYQWQHIPTKYNMSVSRLTPLALTYVDPNSNDATTNSTNILESITNAPLKVYDFEKRLNSRLHYTYTQQNYRSTRSKPTYWYQLGAEYGGNIPTIIEGLGNWLNWGGDVGGDTLNSAIEFERNESTPDSTVTDFLRIGLYAKAFGEGKIFLPLGQNSEIILRGRFSAATPFGRSQVIPKEYRAFAGGVNGLRGWQANTLGPGTISPSELGINDSTIGNFYSFVAPGGDYALEFNLEYRFQPITYVEFALFTDWGNVWLNRRSAEVLVPAEFVDQAVLSRQNFKLGWDFGLGIRLDFDYVIIRLDLAQPLFDPGLIDDESGNNGWIFTPGKDQLFQGGLSPIPSLGINYPF
ncbi:MAG: BamA/TamA family outer membrane protein [Bacteroidota bacterium]